MASKKKPTPKAKAKAQVKVTGGPKTLKEAIDRAADKALTQTVRKIAKDLTAAPKAKTTAGGKPAAKRPDQAPGPAGQIKPKKAESVPTDPAQAVKDQIGRLGTEKPLQYGEDVTFGYVPLPDDEDRTRHSKKRMIRAMAQTGCIVLHAAPLVPISRDRHYEWLKTDPGYVAAIERLSDIPLDVAETALMRQVERGNIAAIIFYLKTRGKKRGYIENANVSVSNPDGSPLLSSWAQIARGLEKPNMTDAGSEDPLEALLGQLKNEAAGREADENAPAAAEPEPVKVPRSH